MMFILYSCFPNIHVLHEWVPSRFVFQVIHLFTIQVFDVPIVQFGSYIHIQVVHLNFVLQVLVDPDVQFGLYIQLPVSKCLPRFPSLPVNAKDVFKCCSFQMKTTITLFSSELLSFFCLIMMIPIVLQGLIVLVECFHSPLCLFGF